jgi:hypothetical protein
MLYGLLGMTMSHPKVTAPILSSATLTRFPQMLDPNERYE